MGVTREIKRRCRAAIAPFLCVCAVAYFGFHFVQGERGLIAWLRLSQQIEVTDARLQLATVERQRLEHRIDLLGPDRLDADMLDERSRAVLGLAHPDEIVVLGR
jgi:cell division protein FtsB